MAVNLNGRKIDGFKQIQNQFFLFLMHIFFYAMLVMGNRKENVNRSLE